MMQYTAPILEPCPRCGAERSHVKGPEIRRATSLSGEPTRYVWCTMCDFDLYTDEEQSEGHAADLWNDLPRKEERRRTVIKPPYNFDFQMPADDDLPRHAVSIMDEAIRKHRAMIEAHLQTLVSEGTLVTRISLQSGPGTETTVLVDNVPNDSFRIYYQDGKTR